MIPTSSHPARSCASDCTWGEDFALFVEEGDGAERERLAKRGREVAEQFRAQNTGERLERYFTSRL